MEIRIPNMIPWLSPPENMAIRQSANEATIDIAAFNNGSVAISKFVFIGCLPNSLSSIPWLILYLLI